MTRQLTQLQSECFAAFDTLPQIYRDLMASSAGTFDQTLVWMRAFAQHVVPAGEQLMLLGLRDTRNDAAAAFLPLRSTRGFRGPLPLRSVSALANYYTANYGPVYAAEQDPILVSTALAQALTSPAAEWNLLDLNPMAPEHPFFEICSQSLRAAGCLVQPYFRFGNWYLEVGGRSSAEYFRDLPSRLRSTLTRKSKKLRARTDLKIEIVQDPAQVDAAMDAYEQIYGRSWKQPEPYAGFIRTIAREFAEQGWLRLGLVRVGGVPAAAQIWFVYRGTASIFKLAYDPEFGELSVGSVLTMKLMEQVLDHDRVAVVDYLCGDDAYKRDWMSHRRERWGLRASPWFGLMGLTEAAQVLAGRVVRLLRRPGARVTPRTDQTAAGGI